MKMMCVLLLGIPMGIGLALLTQDVSHLLATVER